MIFVGLEGKDLDDRVATVLKKVRLYEARKKQVGKYSGGMKRRLSVAIAIVGRPRVLYLDEPSTVIYVPFHSNLRDLIPRVAKTFGK